MHSHLLLWHEVLEHLGTLYFVGSAKEAWREEMVGSAYSPISQLTLSPAFSLPPSPGRAHLTTFGILWKTKMN